MKFCSRPFEYLYLDNYHGDVSLCQWMKKEHLFIGSLENDSAENLWRNSKAEEQRNVFRNGGGGFPLCRVEACPLLQNNSLPDVSEEYAASYKVSETPRIINMAFDFMCNQYCETCRPDKFRPILPRYRNYMEKIHREILPFLNNAHEITASGHGDPFASPYMMKILSDLSPRSPKTRILLETNGVYFDERHWRKIEHLGNCHLTVVVTINSYDEFTYNHISRGGNLKKALANIRFMGELRRQKLIDNLVLSFVIQDRNFRELPTFIEKSLNEYNADKVVLKPVYQWGTMPADVFWFKDVLNPIHPYHAEYQEILEMPVMRQPRVYNFGGRSIHPAAPFPGHSPSACKPL